MEKIKSITEAYSMQPDTRIVQSKEYYNSVPEISKPDVCKEIKLETRQISTDKRTSVYVGYNFNNQQIFMYLANSVNVHYIVN